MRIDATTRWRHRLDLDDLDDVVGRSPALALVFEHVARIAEFERLPVLLTGPSGTGKSLLARAIHAARRRSGPFVELNCGALPEPLVENELFGAEKGSHSTADATRGGKIAAATGGTLFLDEVAELSLGAQAKLLTLLQSGSYYSLGATRPTRADISVICATNRNLDVCSRAGSFRSDLLYRIEGYPIRMPGLEERREDIPLLAIHVLERLAHVYEREVLELSAAAVQALIAESWPGHVRQLENVVRRAAVRAWFEGARVVEPAHLQDSRQPSSGLRETVLSFKRSLVVCALEHTGWNVKEAASLLRVARSGVYKLIRDFDLSQPCGVAEREIRPARLAGIGEPSGGSE